MTAVQRWLVSAIAGLVAALVIEVATIRAFGVRTAHALGYGIGVAVFASVHLLLLQPRGQRDPRRALLLGVVLGVIVAVAGWLGGDVVQRGR